MVWFFKNIFHEFLSDIYVYRRYCDALRKFTKSALTVLNCFKTTLEKRMQVREIEQETGLHGARPNTLYAF
jgi:hypothetical protein